MIIRIVLLAFGLVASAPFAGQAVHAQQSGGATCMPPDEFSKLMVLHYRHLVTSTDTSVAPTREIMKLPIVSATSVSYVTDDSICAKAEAAYSAAASNAPGSPSGRVHVFKVGDVYVVSDTARRTGKYDVRMTLSKSYNVLGRYH
jgi:hypothetical protein